MSSLLSDNFERDLDYAIGSKILGLSFDPGGHKIIVKTASGQYYEFGTEEIANYENN